MQTDSFVRPLPRSDGGPGGFEVFDGAAEAVVARCTHRMEAGEARSGGGGASGLTPVTLRVGPAEVSALREAVDVFLAFQIAGEAHRILEDLYVMFASWEHGDDG